MQARLEKIYQKIQTLVDENHRMKSELSQLNQEIERLKQENIDIISTTVDKETMHIPANIDNLATDNSRKEEINNKLDQYISEVEYCIKQLEMNE